jgi:DNA-binding phage protein
MLKVLVPVREDIMRAAQYRKIAGSVDGVSDFLGELLDLGFESRLRNLYHRYEAGEVSFGRLADELGMNSRDLYAALEDRGLPTSNMLVSTRVTGILLQENTW